MNGPEGTDPAPEITADQASLIAEANAALAGAPLDPVAAAAAAEEAAAAELIEPWAPFLKTAIAPLLFGMVLPQWDVSQEERDEWTDALGQCLDQVLPGGPAGRYACWIRLVLGTGAIVGVRYVQHGRKLPPLGPRLLEHKASDVAPAP